jgi:hypothetical protein
MKSGTISKWRKKEGDAFKPGESIADVETDKVWRRAAWQFLASAAGFD